MDSQNKSAELFVSYDRNNITVRLYSENVYDYYKDCRARNKAFYSCDLIEMPSGMVTPDGYYYSIRGKKSLKEFVCGEEAFDIKMLKKLFDAMAFAIKRAIESNIQMTDLVFDYNCVFLQPSGNGFSFVYMPGAALASNASSPGDLASVAFFNIDADTISEELYEKLKEETSNISLSNKPIEIVSRAIEMSSMIAAYLEENQSFTEKLKKKILNKSEKKDKTVRKKEEPAEEYDKKIELVSGDNVLFEKYIKSGSEEKIKIGRDDEWADITVDGAFSSRRHAELLIAKDGTVCIVDYSLNGTYVDGERTQGSKSYAVGEKGICLTIGSSVDFVLKIEKVSA